MKKKYMDFVNENEYGWWTCSKCLIDIGQDMINKLLNKAYEVREQPIVMYDDIFKCPECKVMLEWFDCDSGKRMKV